MTEPVGVVGESSASVRAFSGTQTVGSDEFLRLLTLQLRYQNPLEPMKETEFVTQLAQFSQLEALQKLHSTLSEALARQDALAALGRGVELLGRRVVVRTGDRSVEGPVEGLRLDPGGTRVVVGGSEFDITDVVEVRS